MPFSDWPKTLADAKTILGNSAKIPSGKMPGVLKNKDDYNKLANAFGTLVETMEKKLLELQNAASKIKNSVDQADNEISDDNYGLDARKPDDKKKIDQAQALFTKYFKSCDQEVDDMMKVLGQLDKHLEQLGKSSP
jgi:hypothetical protein